MRLISWLLRAFIFFVLFAFALNNQQIVTVNWFFGADWHAPMVIVVLVVFACGCALGVLAMLPDVWRRRQAQPAKAAETRNTAPGPMPSELQMAGLETQPGSLNAGPSFRPDTQGAAGHPHNNSLQTRNGV